MRLKLISILFIAMLLPIGIAGAQVIKELPQKQELDNFTATLHKGSYFTNTATLEAIEQHPTWPHDVWMDNDGEFYISFYYLNNNSSKGHSSVYYDDCGNKISNCRLSLKLVEPYYGLNVTEEDTTDPIIIDDPIEENTTPYSPKPVYTEPTEAQNNALVNTGNQTGNNITMIEASGNLTSGENSTGTVNNQGWIGRVEQYIFDFSNTNWSNVTLKFWGD